MGMKVEELITDRVSECKARGEAYKRWLRILRWPNVLLVGGGSLLAFLGGAAIISHKFEDAAGYMALVGGALTGLHAWFGCETHQQKCRSIQMHYFAYQSKYESLSLEDDDKKAKLKALEEQYADFISGIDAHPWM